MNGVVKVTEALFKEWEQINLLHPEKYLTLEEFLAKWTYPNEKQVEGRFKREK